jgi:carboxymethylenebutenolidase
MSIFEGREQMAGQMVQFAANGGTCDGYLATPAAGGKHPGVVVIQEWWGLVGHIKDVAERFASEGFVALAPDLYHGKQTGEPDEAGKLMMSLQAQEVVKDLDGTVAYLLRNENVAGDRVGVVGYCLGGGLSLYEACHNPSKIGACVVYYGVLPGWQPDLSKLQAPVLGLYAEKDSYMPPAAVDELRKQLQSLGKQADLRVYPKTDHGFFNDDRPEVHDKEAAKDAWQRTVDFCKTNLRS